MKGERGRELCWLSPIQKGTKERGNGEGDMWGWGSTSW